MKKLFLVTALSIIFVVTLATISGAVDATYVSYYLPYLHSNTNNTVYCVVTNFGTHADNVTHVAFTVMGNSSGSTTRNNKVMFSNDVIDKFAYRMTTQIAFSGQGIYFGTSTENKNTDLSSIISTSESYGARLTFISTIKFGTNAKRDSHLNCKNISMACFQGTTSPKRNLVGYSCESGYTSDPDTPDTYRPYNITPANFAGETTADNATGYTY
ncbi:MAG: hypothetical protein H7844_02915 [Nitrospirae bacterium YQR-1]